ncbi:MAG: NAD-dependent epimerase/dehydratase family protein [Euryarchaeota archaeon]|nr:NAD-dependent epimerase/dehydratase family protein [Euryarchaeota archaeon]
MNILITGGLGYLGGRLADHLLKKNIHELTLTTYPEIYKIPDSLKNINIQNVNILDKERLIEVCKDIDYIIHLAATNEIMSVTNPHEALKITAEGTLNILEVAKEIGINKFMYFSTFHVYGPIKGMKITEKQLPNPVHPYSITHYIAELYVNQFRQNYDFETIIIRLSNSYGAPLTADVDRWTLVVNDLCYQAIKYGQLQLKSSGKQHRDFIPMRDVLHAVDLLLSTPYEKVGDGLFNVGSGYSISIREMCERISTIYYKQYGKQLPIIVSKESLKENNTAIQYDISKIKKLGFTPSDNYEEEILNTLKMCEKKIQKER